jgi:periplasmic protein CpxP/Spy
MKAFDDDPLKLIEGVKLHMKKFGRFQALTTSAVMAVALVAPFAQSPSATTQDAEQGAKQERRGGKRGFGRHHGRRGGLLSGRMAERLNVTDAQKAQMKQIAESYRERMKPLREELRTKRQALRQAQQGNTFNEALAAQALGETAGVKARLMGERFRMRQEMLAVLTPEQKTQLDQMRQEFKTKREQFKSRRAERGTRQG